MDDPPQPVLQRPPGHRDPAAPPPAVSPVKPPPRLSQVPPTHQPQQIPPRRHHHTSCCCRICCWLTLILLILILIIGSAAAAFYFLFHPELPYFHLNSLKATQFNISTGGDGTLVNSNITLAIEVSNRNSKIGVSYGVMEVRVSAADDDGDVPLGSGKVPDFVEGTGNSRVVRMNVVAKGVLVDDGAGLRLKERFKSKEIMFGVDIRTRFGMRVSDLKTGKVAVRWFCGPVSLKEAERGGENCGINLFKWIFVH